MTYEEIKKRLTKCETILKKVQSNNNHKPQVDVVKLEEKITFLKESLTKKAIELKLTNLKEQEDKGTEGTVSTDDEGEAEDLAKKGVNVKLTKEQADILFTVEETKAIAKEVAKSLLAALRDVGDEVASGKIKNIEENSFDIFVEYKNDFEDEFSFYIKDDTLHLVDFSFDKEIGEVGVKPSGEAIVHKDVITNNLVKHFQALNEQEYAKDIEVQADEEEEYQKLKNIDTVKEFGPMYGSQNRENSESEELRRIGEIDDLLTHTDNQEAFYAWDRAANTYLGRGDAQYWADLDPQDLELAIDDGEDIIRKYNLEEINEEENDRQKYLRILDMYKRAGRIDRETLKPKLEKAAKQLGIKLQLNEHGEIEGADMEVGHQDDEPSMLKKDIYDIAVYAAKLYKQLDKYDQMDGEVDFPHWWQGKVIKAREFISSAQHYLEAEEKQPMIDALALQEGVFDQFDAIPKRGNLDFNDILYLRGAVADLKDEIAQLYRDMEQEAEPEGGPVADMYGNLLNKAEEKLYRMQKQIADYDMNERKEGASAEEEEKFHKKLDTLVHKTFGHSSDEKKDRNEGKQTEAELKDKWREWNKKHPKDQVDWNEYREEHGDELIKEININPEAEKYVKRFIKGVAKKYGYDEMDAVHLIYQVLANTGYLDMRLEEIKNLQEEATCCGKCGRVHVKGNCKRPFLKGAKHCRNNK